MPTHWLRYAVASGKMSPSPDLGKTRRYLVELALHTQDVNIFAVRNFDGRLHHHTGVAAVGRLGAEFCVLVPVLWAAPDDSSLHFSRWRQARRACRYPQGNT